MTGGPKSDSGVVSGFPAELDERARNHLAPVMFGEDAPGKQHNVDGSPLRGLTRIGQAPVGRRVVAGMVARALPP